MAFKAAGRMTGADSGLSISSPRRVRASVSTETVSGSTIASESDAAGFGVVGITTDRSEEAARSKLSAGSGDLGNAGASGLCSKLSAGEDWARGIDDDATDAGITAAEIIAAGIVTAETGNVGTIAGTAARKAGKLSRLTKFPSGWVRGTLGSVDTERADSSTPDVLDEISSRTIEAFESVVSTVLACPRGAAIFVVGMTGVLGTRRASRTVVGVVAPSSELDGTRDCKSDGASGEASKLWAGADVGSGSSRTTVGLATIGRVGCEFDGLAGAVLVVRSADSFSSLTVGTTRKGIEEAFSLAADRIAVAKIPLGSEGVSLGFVCGAEIASMSETEFTIRELLVDALGVGSTRGLIKGVTRKKSATALIVESEAF